MCLFNDRDRLESLAKNDWTPFVWRKTVTRESNQRKNRYEQLAKEFREASRTEVNDCLGQMLTTCLQNSPHVEANNSFFLAAINVSEDKVSDKSARRKLLINYLHYLQTLSEVVKTAASANANLSVMIFAYHTVQKQLTMRCSVPKGKS